MCIGTRIPCDATKKLCKQVGGFYGHVDVSKWPDMKLTGPGKITAINKCVPLGNACTASLVWSGQIGFKSKLLVCLYFRK